MKQCKLSQKKVSWLFRLDYKIKNEDLSKLKGGTTMASLCFGVGLFGPFITLGGPSFHAITKNIALACWNS